MSSARIVGVIAVALFGLLLLATLVASLGPNKVVVPTNGVTAGGPRDNPAGTSQLGALESRTQMQKWPGETTSAPATSRALAPGAPGASTPGGQLVEQWQASKGENRGILDSPEYRRGVATIPGTERGVLMQPQGRTWRDYHNDKIAYGGAIYVFGLSFLIAIFLAWRGRIRVAEGFSGETVERFSAFERANHWLTAVSFLLMAFTGVIILYGNGLIRPWLGAGLYSDLASFSAWSHMTLAVPFVIGVLVMIVLWIGGNLPERLDWQWLKQGGGFLDDSPDKPPARRFNTGQKIVFWGVALGGLALTLTGIGLMFPFYWAGYTGMQVAQSVHAALALLMIGLIIGHIYIGTIGMEGAFDAMWTGRVDRNWAKEHHSLWYPEAASEAAMEPPQAGRRRTGGAVGWFATGVAAALILALVMDAAYQLASINSAAATANNNPSVHLGADRAAQRGK